MIKKVNDYIQELKEEFPEISIKDIKRSVNYGWRMFYYYNLRGCDTIFNSQKYKYWIYCGELTKDSVKHFNYYKRMLRRKLRVLYNKKVKEWDGYYYIGLTDSEYNQLIPKSKGRKKKNFYFYNKVLLKVKDEAMLFYSWSKYIIRFKYPIDVGYSLFKPKLKCEYPEIVVQKSRPSKFEDILVSNNNYELIKI